MSAEYIFWHKCIIDDCERFVEIDDEPWCFTHSPPSGSSLAGFSARAVATNLSPHEVISTLMTELARLNQENQLPLSNNVDLRVQAALAQAEAWLKSRATSG